MSDPQTPSPSAATPAKKKTSPWVWVLGGCLVLLVLILLVMGTCTWFVADKAKEFAEEMEANPAKMAAELAVRVDPDLEIVESDDEAGTLTVRRKSTGEVYTANFDDIAEGKMTIETPQGESSISFDPTEGGLTVQGPGGETTTFGASASDELAEWIPRYPGASEPEGAFSSTSGDQRSGSASFRTTDPVARVLEFYERSLKAAGMEVSKTTFTAQGSDGGMITANSDDPQRSVTVMVSDEDGETLVNATFNESI